LSGNDRGSHHFERTSYETPNGRKAALSRKGQDASYSVAWADGFIDSVTLVDAGKINAMALGYIYGLADRALQLAKLDVGSEDGSELVFNVISEFDEPNVGRQYEYLRSLSDRTRLMEGVMLGRNDYDAWQKSHRLRIALRWCECRSPLDNPRIKLTVDP
jgi:hypothetical protein